MTRRRRPGRIAVSLAVAMVICVASIAGLARFELRSGSGFDVAERSVIYNIFDLGVGDLDGDGVLDRWTVNHSAQQHIFSINDHLQLYQDQSLPGFEPDGQPVVHLEPLHLYTDESRFVVASGEGGHVSGRLRVPWPTEFSVTGQAAAEADNCEPEPECTEIAFSVSDDGAVFMMPVPAPSDGFPVRFVLNPEIDLQTVALGRQGIVPASHSFTYHSKDRHALVVLEDASERGQALFISRGGARGLLDQAHPGARDEFLIRDGQTWIDEAAARKLVKAGCPGRQAAAFDVNGDGRLDIYQVCGRSSGDNSAVPNRLYMQQEDGTYREEAAERGLDLASSGSFRFLRGGQGDGSLQMLWVAETEAQLFEADAEGRFRLLWTQPRVGTDIDKIVIFRFEDAPGPARALIFSRFGNQYLALDETAPTLLSVQTAGLPAASTEGSVMDIDGDGMLDVLAVPQGIFLGRDGGGFEASDLLDLSWLDPVRPTRIAWLDYDGDGDLDLWLTIEGGRFWPWPLNGIYRRLPAGVQDWVKAVFPRHPVPRRYWMTELYENTLDHGRTRQVPLKNGEALRVTLEGPERLQSRLIPAGAHDTSRFSDTMHDVFVTVPDGQLLISTEIRPR